MDAQAVAGLLRADRCRWQLLDLVRTLDLPDCWIAAGCIRNAVWDHLHGRPPSPPDADVDVIWYDNRHVDPAIDRQLEQRLRTMAPDILWSVKNQARMHRRNQDAPYQCAIDAMRHWPETATAIAARRDGADRCVIAAPLGLDDLWSLKLRANAGFATGRRGIFESRWREKRWTTRWPQLCLTSD